MPRGNTATITVATFKADWAAGLPIAVLCSSYSISRDQVIRLRDLWSLPLRNDRKHRYRQPGADRDPTPEEIRERCLEIQATWSDRTRQDRHWRKPQDWAVPMIEFFSDGHAMPEEQDTIEEQ